MRRSGRKRRIFRKALFVPALAGLLLALPPAGADQTPRAVVNGQALAAGARIPFEVNPDFEFSPVYSLSKVGNSLTHGISAGFWPGFLIDAFAFSYGYQEPARSMMGVAETLWPQGPKEDTSATSDFGEKCPFFGLLGLPPEFAESFTSGCHVFWDSLGTQFPYQAASGRSKSDLLVTNGSADGLRIDLPGGVSIGNGRVTSSSDGRTGKTVSEATLVLSDVAIGESLRIREIRSLARAVSDGTPSGIKSTHVFEIVGATFNGQDVVIGEDGPRMIEDNEAVDGVQEQLAAEGFDVRLVHGADIRGTDEAESDSGGLVVRMTRSGPPKELADANSAACAAIAEAQPEPIYRQPYDLGDNPLYDADRFPLNQLPSRLEGDEPVPPIIPCVGALLERAANVGVILGTTSASARYVPLPALPPLPPSVPGTPDQVIFETVTIPGQPPSAAPGTEVLGFQVGEAPPSAAVPAATVDPLAGTPGRVKLLYGGIAALLGLVLVGRGTFRHLVRT